MKVVGIHKSLKAQITGSQFTYNLFKRYHSNIDRNHPKNTSKYYKTKC